MYEFEKDIKRCPFCGGTAELTETNLVSAVRCTHCGAEIRRCSNTWGKPERSAYAVSCWNSREPETFAGCKGRGPLFCSANEQLNALTRVSNIVQGAPDSVVVEFVLEHMDGVAPETRYYITELVNRLHRKDSIIRDIYKSFVESSDPYVPRELR